MPKCLMDLRKIHKLTVEGSLTMKLFKTITCISLLGAALLNFHSSAYAQTEWKFNNSYATFSARVIANSKLCNRRGKAHGREAQDFCL